MIAHKITRLVLLLGLFASFTVTGFVSLREFSVARDRVVESSQAMLLGQPRLPILLYQEDFQQLQAFLAEMLDTPSIRYATLFDSSGTPLIEQHRKGNSIYPLPTYKCTAIRP